MLEHNTDKEGQQYTTLQDVIGAGNRVVMRYENLLVDTRQLERTSNWWQRLLKVIPVSDINETMEMLDRNNEFLYEYQRGIKLLRGDKLPKLPSADWQQLARLTDQASEYATYCTNEGSNLEDTVSDTQTQIEELEDAVNTMKDTIEAVGDVADEVISNANEVEDYGRQIQAWIESEIPQGLRW